jgi:hypothetical protein
MTTVKLADLDWIDIGHRWERASIYLERGETAPNPASTKPERQIHGPATVTYDRHPTQILIHVEEGPQRAPGS